MALNSDALRVFLAVVDTGSMSAAAEFLGQTASGVSRSLSRLETQLGVTLLTRTTRRMELTEEGRLFLQRARGIVGELDEAEECMRIRRQQPAGKLRVDASAPVMLHCVVPHIAAFRAAYPEISLELTSNDRIVDLVEHRTDIALRAGPLSDSSLHARPLRPAPRFVVASPAYVARRGNPASAEDLRGHELLGFTLPETLNLWPLRHAGGTGYAITPTLAASSGETQRLLAVNGVHRLPVGIHAERGSGGRPPGEAAGARAYRLSAAHACGVLPQYAIGAPHRLLPGFFCRAHLGPGPVGARIHATRRALRQRIVPSRAGTARPATGRRSPRRASVSAATAARRSSV